VVMHTLSRALLIFCLLIAFAGVVVAAAVATSVEFFAIKHFWVAAAQSLIRTVRERL